MQILKNHKYLFSLLIICCLLACAFLLDRRSSQNLLKEQPDVRDSMRSSERMKVRGFRYYGTSEGKRVLALRADKFTVEKKKIAFFRSALSNSAYLRNGRIDIYGVKETVKGASGSTGEIAQPALALSQVFSKESWPTISSKRVSEIRAEPVTVRIHDEKSLLTEIHADAAVVSPKRRDFLFEGNVLVKSGGREMRTGKLFFIPDGCLMKTDEACEITEGGRTMKGSGLVTDIFLRRLEWRKDKK